THAGAVSLQQQLEKAASKDRGLLQTQLETTMHSLEDYVDELSEVGCDLKDYQMGLIDFTGRHQGRDVCLCWKLGEEKIAFWHEMESGVAGRKPVSLLLEGECHPTGLTIRQRPLQYGGGLFIRISQSSGFESMQRIRGSLCS